ncbi:cytochrome c biogenesis protein CcdC [Bacillus smithii]|uniref:CcdC family protein n=1 Tax=Bacillus smithii TaxID=1479 RepID=UPI002E20EEC2|nr:cytochrome c biogenesis protein CcdC [Bacillus smithii]MED4927112.1 cytochrome c biogenesis protein CcdC [Bacillus smithii]
MWLIASSIFAVVMGVSVIMIRLKAAKKPTSVKKIILPPIFMSTGSLMYLFPQFRITPMEMMESIMLGMLCSIILIKTSRFEIRDNEIYLKRSKAFVYILMTLLIVRLIVKAILSTTIHVGQLSGMFFLLAFSMIVPWRIAMYIQYKKMLNQLNDGPIQTNSL